MTGRLKVRFLEAGAPTGTSGRPPPIFQVRLARMQPLSLFNH
jgi:hypothetical protein